MKTLLVTLGDAAGIGPEIITKLFAAVRVPDGFRAVVVGELDILAETAARHDLPVRFVSEGEAATDAGASVVPVRSLGLLKVRDVAPGALSAACGDAAFRYFEHAVNECLAGRAHAIVTAPLHKEAMNRAGHAYAGHTEILEAMTGVAGPVMALWHPRVVVAHVTDHMPLRAALDAITLERIVRVVTLAHDALVRAGTPAPRIALAGVNPHAGEGGLFGREEIEIVKPAMERLRAAGIETSGPHPADTVFLQALRGRHDAVIAMYHDQGFGPMKTIGFADGVNCTLGLPFARTSPDHGTAFEIAGQGVAEPESMIAAWNLAVRLMADGR